MGRSALSSTRFVTPSAHRVHHGSNPEYLDKNFGSMLIVWDRLFGTYAPETVPVRYGLVGGKRVTTPAQALAGGYPALVSAVRAQPGVAGRARYLPRGAVNGTHPPSPRRWVAVPSGRRRRATLTSV